MDTRRIRVIAGALAFLGFIFSVPSYLNDAETWARWLDISELATWLWPPHTILGLSSVAFFFALYPRRQIPRQEPLSDEELFSDLHYDLCQFRAELNAARAQYDAFRNIPSYPIKIRIRHLATVLYSLNIPVPETVNTPHYIVTIDRWRAFIPLLIRFSKNAELESARLIKLGEDS